AALDLVPGLLLIPGALLLMLKRRAVQRVGHAVVVVRRRRWLAGGLLCAVGALALARAWPFTGDPYPPYSDLGLAPHQALIEYVDRLGGVTVWSLPEARDSGEQWLGPVRVAWQTDPYPDDLLRTFRYTAFGAVYEDTTRFDLGGGGTAVWGGTLATGEGWLRGGGVGIDAVAGGARAVRVARLRNGTLAGAWTATTPFRVVHREGYDGGPAFYRLDARGPGRLL